MELLIAATVGNVLLVRVPMLSEDVFDVMLSQAVELWVDSGAVAANESPVRNVCMCRQVRLTVNAVRVELVIGDKFGQVVLQLLWLLLLVKAWNSLGVAGDPRDDGVFELFAVDLGHVISCMENSFFELIVDEHIITPVMWVQCLGLSRNLLLQFLQHLLAIRICFFRFRLWHDAQWTTAIWDAHTLEARF